MVDAKAGIAFPAVSLVIPERIHRRIGMHRADRIDPALIEQTPKQRPRLRLYKRVLRVGLGWVDFGLCLAWRLWVMGGISIVFEHLREDGTPD